MLLPNKIISYNESILSKFPIVLDVLNDNDYLIFDLYEQLKTSLDIESFIEVLDCLFALGKIEIDYVTRSIRYAV